MKREQIIDKWELILQMDSGKDITYGRSVLQEMLSDFKEILALPLDVPSDDWIDEVADKYGFRVPYDGSDNFYDNKAIKHYMDGLKKMRDEIIKRNK